MKFQRLLILVTTALCLIATSEAWAQTPAFEHKTSTPLKTNSPLDLWQRGDRDAAQVAAKTRDDTPALVVRALGQTLEGNFDKAEEFAREATRVASSPADRASSTWVSASIARLKGDRKDAERLLRAELSANSKAHDVRFELGSLLMESGRESEARMILDVFSRFYNNSVLKSSHDHALLGDAMRLLGSFQDANHAFQEAFDLDSKNADALVRWGYLLLGKYNTADAERTFKDALKAQPNYPPALVGLARTELLLSNQYAKVRDQLGKAAMLAPADALMAITNAEVAIYDSNCEAARSHVEPVLKREPQNLRALTILAMCEYVEDDLEGYEAIRDQVLKLNPKYSFVLTETARVAEREHRYDEAADLNRQALVVRPGDPNALLQLGIGLSRIGKEDEAKDVLKSAFDSDPYNVRAFNMVELYDTIMPEYEFTEYSGYRIRAHSRENAMINELVAPVVSEAMSVFGEKYKHQTDPYLAVEIYPSSETFAVRSVGLPNISLHGICFGKVVVSRSPSEGNFNWRQVIWHELAHVYHIQISRGRVPRWFTEGLAEYETNIKDKSWNRHHDRELSKALAAGSLRGVGTLDHGFTHASSFEEILRSYHQASLEVHYLAETYGFDVLVKMLQGWGESQTTEEVFKSIGTTLEAHDAGFEKWLSRRYMNFHKQLTFDFSSVGTLTEEESASAKGSATGIDFAKLGIARVRAGDKKGALEAIQRAQKKEPKDATVALISALILMDLNQVRDAYAQALVVLDAGRDSYDIRVLLGSAALSLERPEEAEVHFQAATQLWRDGADAWEAIQRLAAKREDKGLANQSLLRLFELDQNDALVARMYAKQMVEQGHKKEALRAVQQWRDIAPFDVRSHEAFANVALLNGDEAAARRSWKLLLTLRPRDRDKIYVEAIALAMEHERSKLAASLKQEAVKAGVPERKLKSKK